jgi:glycosyltransferase involved in cell wall biosynthesis
MTSATRRVASRLRRGGRASAPDSSGPDYVCMAGIDWWYDSHAHSEAQLLRRVARTRRVLFVNSVGMRLPRPGRDSRAFRRILRKVASVLRVVRRPVPEAPNFFVLSPVVIPLYTSRTGRSLNAAVVRAQVSLAERVLGIRRPIRVITLPTAWDAVRRLPRSALVVNKADKYSSLLDVDQASVAQAEQELLERADVVLYVSRELMDEDLSVVKERGVFFDHGVDIDHFTRRPPSQVPADLGPIPEPRIGFFGSLDDYRLDMDLLERIAREIPEAQLVLIGAAMSSMDRFRPLSNVHWLGPRPYEEIPAYGSGFTIGLMPYLRNEWTRHINPIKSREYLALGLPVVATRVPQLEEFADLMLIADNQDDFIAAVRSALEGDAPSNPTDRRAAVARFSWDDRAAQLMALAESSAD